MTEREREEIAMFRYGVISDVVSAELARGEPKRLLREKAARQWRLPNQELATYSMSTLRSWVRDYRDGGVDGLKPEPRRDKGKPRALPEEVRRVLAQMRQEHPQWSVPEIVSQVREAGLVLPDQPLPLSTLYRRIGRSRAPAAPAAQDRRKFAFERPLACVQADVMYGPYVRIEDQLRRSYLHLLLDDCTRLVLEGCFHLEQNLASFAATLKQALRRRGYVPERLYTDNGAAFVAHDLTWSLAQLGLHLIHTRPGEPQGRGKIERFFRTVREQFLTVRWRPLMTLEELNAAFWDWVERDYHRRPHQGLQGQTPLDAWTARADQLQRRPRVLPERLDDIFRRRQVRLVKRDRTFSLDGRLWEAPVEVVGCRIEVLCPFDAPEPVEIRYQERSLGRARRVDLYVNSQARRTLRFDQEG
jgi:transposase InsO family protein